MSVTTKIDEIGPVVDRYFELGLNHKGIRLSDYVEDQQRCEATVALVDRIRARRPLIRMTSNGHTVTVHEIRRV